jgi:two-component system chemotaxis response regulator CheB
MAFKVLIVDDSSFFRRRVTDILNQDKDLEVIGTAVNGKEAVDKAIELRPDVITMDVEMPVMDGITSVREIMKAAPVPILMFSSLTHQGAKATFDALDAGALDFLPKKFEDIARDKKEASETLQQRVKAIARKRTFYRGAPPSSTSSSSSSASSSGLSSTRASTSSTSSASSNSLRSSSRLSSRTDASSDSRSNLGSATSRLQERNLRQSRTGDSRVERRPLGSSREPERTVSKPAAPAPSQSRGSRAVKDFKLLAIGTSTGGPVALQKILTQLPQNYPKPIVLVQHMPATFTSAFASRLNTLCKITVKEAENGELLKPGVAYLAPGGQQMMIEGSANAAKLKVKVDDSPRITYKPSVDITFGTAARVFNDQVLALVLTGMGADGRDGSRMLKNQGSRIWAQDEASCVVYGMPQAVHNAGLSECDIALDEIAARIIKEAGHG